MRLDWITAIGLIAGALTTLSYFPQVLRTLKTKQTKDISMLMYIILATGLFLWFLYGIFLKDTPIIIANSVTFVLATIVLILKIRYG